MHRCSLSQMFSRMTRWGIDMPEPLMREARWMWVCYDSNPFLPNGLIH